MQNETWPRLHHTTVEHTEAAMQWIILIVVLRRLFPWLRVPPSSPAAAAPIVILTDQMEKRDMDNTLKVPHQLLLLVVHFGVVSVCSLPLLFVLLRP